MNKYKIGDFSNYLGVTPDLIKHYEKYDIIKGIKNEQTNYRYYSFWQSSNIFLSKMYQNLGFTLREISHILNHAETSEIFTELKTKADILKQTINKETIILEKINEIVQYEDEIKNNSFNGGWEIKTVNPFYFMAHSENCKYSQELINDIPIQQWVNLLPITSLCTKINMEDGIEEAVYFGMSVSKENAEMFDVNIDEPIERVESKKALIYKSKLTAISADPVEIANRLLKDPLELIKKHNFEISGDIYIKTLLIANHECERSVFRIIYIPIK